MNPARGFVIGIAKKILQPPNRTRKIQLQFTTFLTFKPAKKFGIDALNVLKLYFGSSGYKEKH